MRGLNNASGTTTNPRSGGEGDGDGGALGLVGEENDNTGTGSINDNDDTAARPRQGGTAFVNDNYDYYDRSSILEPISNSNSNSGNNLRRRSPTFSPTTSPTTNNPTEESPLLGTFGGSRGHRFSYVGTRTTVLRGNDAVEEWCTFSSSETSTSTGGSPPPQPSNTNQRKFPDNSDFVDSDRYLFGQHNSEIGSNSISHSRSQDCGPVPDYHYPRNTTTTTNKTTTASVLPRYTDNSNTTNFIGSIATAMDHQEEEDIVDHTHTNAPLAEGAAAEAGADSHGDNHGVSPSSASASESALPPTPEISVPLRSGGGDEGAAGPTSTSTSTNTTTLPQHLSHDTANANADHANTNANINTNRAIGGSMMSTPQRSDSHKSIPSLHPGRTYDSTMMNSQSYDQYTIPCVRGSNSNGNSNSMTRQSSSSQSFAQTRRGSGASPRSHQSHNTRRSMSPYSHGQGGGQGQGGPPHSRQQQRGAPHPHQHPHAHPPSATMQQLQQSYIPPGPVGVQRTTTYGSSSRSGGQSRASSGRSAPAAASANYQYQQQQQQQQHHRQQQHSSSQQSQSQQHHNQQHNSSQQHSHQSQQHQQLSERQLYYNNRATRLLHRGMYNEYHNPDDRYPASSSPILEVPDEIYAVRRAALTVLRPLTRAWVSLCLCFYNRYSSSSIALRLCLCFHQLCWRYSVDFTTCLFRRSRLFVLLVMSLSHKPPLQLCSVVAFCPSVRSFLFISMYLLYPILYNDSWSLRWDSVSRWCWACRDGCTF
jgi:hypothetical protein